MQVIYSNTECFYFPTYNYLLLRSGHGGQDVNAVGWEISSLIGSFINPMSPAGVQNLLSEVLVQHDQVSLQEAQEGGLLASCGNTNRSGFILKTTIKASPSLLLTVNLYSTCILLAVLALASLRFSFFCLYFEFSFRLWLLWIRLFFFGS